MKKIFGFVLITLLLASCGSQFNKSRYGRYMWNRSSGKTEKELITPEKEETKTETAINNSVEDFKISEKENIDKNELATKVSIEKNVNTTITFKNSSITSPNSQNNDLIKSELPVIKKIKKVSDNITMRNLNHNSAADADTMFIIELILCFFIAPLAVFLKEGVTTRFWIDLICYLLGGGLVFSPYFYGGALLLFAIVYALLIVLEVI